MKKFKINSARAMGLMGALAAPFCVGDLSLILLCVAVMGVAVLLVTHYEHSNCEE